MLLSIPIVLLKPLLPQSSSSNLQQSKSVLRRKGAQLTAIFPRKARCSRRREQRALRGEDLRSKQLLLFVFAR